MGLNDLVTLAACLHKISGDLDHNRAFSIQATMTTVVSNGDKVLNLV